MANGELDLIKQLIAFAADPEGKDEKTFDILMATSQASVLASIINIRQELAYVKKYSIGVRVSENKGWSAIVITSAAVLVFSFSQPELREHMVTALKAIIGLLG